MAHWFLKHLVRPSLTDSSPCQQTQAPLSLDNYNVMPCDFRFSRFRIKTFPPHNINKAKIHLHWRITHRPFTCALTALSPEVNKFVSQYISFIDYLLKQAWVDSTKLYIIYSMYQNLPRLNYFSVCNIISHASRYLDIVLYFQTQPHGITQI